MRIGRFITLVVMCVAILAGCGIRPTGSGQPTADGNNAQNVQQRRRPAELTERQKDILEELGLPTDYNDLSPKEKSAIEAIEYMLSYLEGKYGEPFVYAGYVEGGGLEQEHLTAYPESGSMNDEVTVYRSYEDDGFTCTDNYLNILAAPVYQKAMEQYVAKYFTGSTLFTEVTNVPGDELPDEDTALFAITAASTLLLDESAVNEAQLDAFVQDYSTLMEENSTGAPSVMDIWLMEADTVKGFNAYNYHDNLFQAKYSSVWIISVSSSGKVTTTRMDAAQGG